jgi:hypothetical protein
MPKKIYHLCTMLPNRVPTDQKYIPRRHRNFDIKLSHERAARLLDVHRETLKKWREGAGIDWNPGENYKGKVPPVPHYIRWTKERHFFWYYKYELLEWALKYKRPVLARLRRRSYRRGLPPTSCGYIAGIYSR